MVLQDHRVLSGAARRSGEAPRLARARQADAGQLDRSLRGRRGRLYPVRPGWRAHRGRRGQDHRLHHACRYPFWRLLLCPGSRVRRPARARRGHGVRGGRHQDRRGLQAYLCRRACPGHPREARCLHGPLCGKPRQRREGPRVGCRLCRCRLRHRRRHGRSLRRPARL